ncbi:phosphopyruvate hydratase, partial [Patescibacteria group bacterium]|nr:phosphopyruvate hydratase [Patescibacteria group bacterium]
QSCTKGGWLGLDCAATQLPEKIDLSFYELITNNYELLAIEDPYPEEDWDGFCKITAALGEKIWIIGDDLTITNPKIIKTAGEKKAVNAIIIKPTQIGTVTETIQAANLAKSYGWKIIVANRGEETMDDFIADLAVGLGADAIKSGCPLQKERLIKYQRLVEIEKICPI